MNVKMKNQSRDKKRNRTWEKERRMNRKVREQNRLMWITETRKMIAAQNSDTE
jgi:hypothetical protein